MSENRNKIISLFILSTVFLILTALFLFLADPFKLKAWLMALFYLCLGGLSMSLFSLILLAALNSARMAFRQAFWLTLLILGSLLLSSLQLFYWWLEGIFILTLVMIEGYFLSSNNSSNNQNN